MKRIFVGLTLLLSTVISNSISLVTPGLAFGFEPVVVELSMAAIAVAAFLKLGRIRGRIVYPIPGIRFITIGILLSAVPLVLGIGYVIVTVITSGAALHKIWLIFIPAVVFSQYIKPILLVAGVALVFGSFRLLTNLLPANVAVGDAADGI